MHIHSYVLIVELTGGGVNDMDQDRLPYLTRRAGDRQMAISTALAETLAAINS